MNVVLWILQVSLAVFCFAGGAYKIFNFHELATMPQTAALSHATWTALGGLEMACAVLLIVSGVAKRMRFLTPVAAAALVVENVALAAIFARYSLAVTATNPLVWVVGIALTAAVLACGRYLLGARAA